MAGESGGGLSQVFKSAAHKIFKHALIMVPFMMIPGVALAAPAFGGSVPILDSLSIGIEHTFNMFADAVTEFPDYVSSVSLTDWRLTHEWGSMAHHGAQAAAHTGAHVVVEGGLEAAIEGTAHFQESFSEWILNQEAAGQLAAIEELSGGNLVEYYQNGGYYHPPEHHAG